MSIKKKMISLGLAFCMAMSCSVLASADSRSSTKTDVTLSIKASGVYKNWDGTSNVAQFIDDEGCFCFAYDGTANVTVVKMDKNNEQRKETVLLKKLHPLFGTVTCDGNGNFYLVTGETNSGDDTSTETIFISKYDKNGNLIGTVGDNGSSSLAYYYPERFYTKIPFDGGNCSAAVNGDLLSVHYAREMYGGHQSDSVFTININTMSKVSVGSIYSSHSFAQRVIPFGNGFVYASEGDCYSRAFTINTFKGSGSSSEQDIFHFWVQDGAKDSGNMYVLNNNFAHMGGLAQISDSLVAFAGTSAESLNSNANTEKEGLFVQIFDPTKDLTSASSYVTVGTRSGLGGPNGDENVTDYGVKWLIPSSSSVTAKNPQIVYAGGDTAAVLFECYGLNSSGYDGVYYIVINSKGEVVQDAACFSKTARLNPCVMPVYSDGSIYWAGNSTSGSAVYSYKLTVGSKTIDDYIKIVNGITGSGVILTDEQLEAVEKVLEYDYSK
ncbi:MAG: hypothetical protein ACI4YB_10215 [Oscillospiraceae bacterium]